MAHRQQPVLAPDPRGHEKLALQRNVRRATHHSATHTIGWKANGDVCVLLLRSDPGDPGPAGVARVCIYVLCYGSKWAGRPKIQRQIWRRAFRGVDGRCEARSICAKLLNNTVARRMIDKAECAVEAGNHPIGPLVKFP